MRDHAEPVMDALDPHGTDAAGPAAHGDPMGTPKADETVLWKGRPSLPILARTAFHTRSLAIYFVLLIGLALASGDPSSAVVIAVLGIVGLALMQGLAWLSARSTLYILTDVRLIMRVGMAIETRINVPLKHVLAADLRPRGKGHGDIAIELSGERMLGYWLMWPHVRPWRFSMPQPMLRAVPDAEQVAKLLADACAEYNAIERNLIEIKETRAETGKQENGPAAKSAQTGGLSDAGVDRGMKGSLEGAPA